MKFKLVLLSGLFWLLNIQIQASEPDRQKIRCATVEYMKMMEAENPSYLQTKLIDEGLIQQILQGQQFARSTNTTYTIPVVVHVVYKNTAQNISDAQIMSEIDVLNEDYGRYSADTIMTPAVWNSIAGRSSFQFCLARQDPDGNPTNGIERRATTSSSFSSNNNVKHFSAGGLDAWDVNRYFNIWVCNLGNFLLGYAEPPSSVHSNDYGVVIIYDSFGRTGTVASPYNLGRTTTHEIGHAMSLAHIWGDDTNCSGSDGISDTPNQEIETYDCPVAFPLFDNCSSSGNGIMYMNYMDYTDDACMNMFTNGQTNRMRAAMEAFYPTLIVSTACENTTGIIEPLDNFSFSIYPNPSDGMVNLDMFLMENIGSSVNLRVSNLLGKVVKEEVISHPNGKTFQFDLSDQGAGMYFITLFNENFRKTARLELTK